MKTRRPGLQRKWAYVVNSLQEIVPSYEQASSRISIFEDRRMRREAVGFAAAQGGKILDLGSGPGTMSRLVKKAGGEPVLLDASRAMLKASGFKDVVQGVFEHLPFRSGAFEGGVSGFALRDAHDLKLALEEVDRVLRGGGRFSICDLGRPDSVLPELAVAFYLRVAPNVIGLVSAGRSGLRYGSIFDTYMLTLHNEELRGMLEAYIGEARIHETQMGGSIVVSCTKPI